MKSLLKNVIGFSLAAAPIVTALLGLEFFAVRQPVKESIEKSQLLFNYKMCEQYKKDVQKLNEESKIDLSFGDVDVTYNSKIDMSSSEKETEEYILTYGSDELVAEINKLNNIIEEKESISEKGLLISAVSCLMAAPLAMAGKKLIIKSEIDESIIFTPDGEKYLDKPVIM